MSSVKIFRTLLNNNTHVADLQQLLPARLHRAIAVLPVPALPKLLFPITTPVLRVFVLLLFPHLILRLLLQLAGRGSSTLLPLAR
jgi:hypothetical protein